MATGYSHAARAAVQQQTTDQRFARLLLDYDYSKKQLIQEGGFGAVYRITRKTTKQEYALKVILKKHDQQDRQLNNITRERLALRMLNSPFIIKLYESFADKDTVYFLLDLAENGDLFGCVYEKMDTFLDMPAVRFFAAEMVMGLQYIRSHNLVHRDIKLENALVDKNFHIKLSDFGSAKTVGQRQGTSLLRSIMEKNSQTAGTPAFVPPEVYYQEAVTFGTDYWALGFSIFTLYTREFLADRESLDDDEYFQRVEGVQWLYPFTFPNHKIHDLVYQLTRRDPATRLGTADFQKLKDHVFFEGVDWDNLHQSVSPGLLAAKPCFNHRGECPASQVNIISKSIWGTAAAQAPAGAAGGASVAAARTSSRTSSLTSSTSQAGNQLLSTLPSTNPWATVTAPGTPRRTSSPSSQTTTLPSTNPWATVAAAGSPRRTSSPSSPTSRAASTQPSPDPWANVPSSKSRTLLGPAGHAPPSIDLQSFFKTPINKMYMQSQGEGSLKPTTPNQPAQRVPSPQRSSSGTQRTSLSSPSPSRRGLAAANATMTSGYQTDSFQNASTGNTTQSLADMWPLVTSPPPEASDDDGNAD